MNIYGINSIITTVRHKPVFINKIIYLILEYHNS